MWAGAKPSLRLASCCNVDVVKGGCGLRLTGLASTDVDREGRGFERLLECFRLRARADVEALQLLAVGADQARLESLIARRRQRRDQRPVFLADEFFDFELAVADQPQRHRLHPARRARPGSLRHSTGDSVKPTR